MIPTIAFGIPGGVTMAILLGAFLIQGVTPGPEMLTRRLDLTMTFVWLIVVANVIAVGLSFLFIRQLARVAYIRPGVLTPLIVLLVYLGAFAEKNTLSDIITMLLFGALGLLMVQFRWPRPPLVLGLVLGRLAENYLFLSVNRYGAEWLTRPLVLTFAVLMLAVLFLPALRARLSRRGGAAAATVEVVD